LLVALNLGGQERDVPGAASGLRVLLSTCMERDGMGAGRLRPDEGVVMGEPAGGG
jgi:hypothetical protein